MKRFLVGNYIQLFHWRHAEQPVLAEGQQILLTSSEDHLSRLQISLVCLVVSILAALIFPHHVLAATYSDPNLLNNRAWNAEGNAIAWDNQCYQNLSYDNQGGRLQTTRAMINGQNGYQQAAYQWFDWISVAGQPNSVTATAAAGSNSPIQLQLNMETFICWPLVNGGLGAFISDPNHYTNDQPPNGDYGTYGESLYDRILYIKRGSVTANNGASVSGSIQYVGATDTARDPNSRFWFNNPVNFQLNPPAGGFTPGTYTVTVPGQAIWVYHQTVAGGGVVACNSPPVTLYNTRNVSTINYSPCVIEQPPLSFSITIKNPNPPPKAPQGNIDSHSCTDPNIIGWAFDNANPGNSINVDVWELNAGSGPMPGYGSPGGVGGGVGRYLADQSRNVDHFFNISGNHGFAINLPTADITEQPHTFYLYAIGQNTNTYIGQVTISGCSPPCPPPAGASSIGAVPVSMPYAGMNNPAHALTSSQPATDPAPQNYEEDQPYTVYYVNNSIVDDTSSGVRYNDANYLPTYVSENDGSATSYYGSFGYNPGVVYLDYTNYQTNLPYDQSTPRITYDSQYYKTIWSPTFTGYSCNTGDSLNGTTCSHTYTALDHYNYTCPSGDYLSMLYGSYVCDSYATYSYDAPATATVSSTYCNPGDSLSSDGSTCTGTYTATANYSWAASPSSLETVSTNEDGPTMQECYNRTFSLAPSNQGNTIWTDQNGNPSGNIAEDPYGMQFSGQVSAQFGETKTAASLRLPYAVTGITTSATITIYHQLASGAQVLVGTFPGSCSPDNNNMQQTYTASGANAYGSGSWSGTISLQALKCTSPRSFTPENGYPYGDQVCVQLSLDPTQGMMNSTGVMQSIGQGLQTESPPMCSGYTYAESYLKIFGGSAAAGASSSDTATCFNVPGANIYAVNQNSSPYAGSGSDFGATATGDINGFASGQVLMNALTSAHNLTFGNTHVQNSSGYGGFGTVDCGSGPDYYDQAVGSDAVMQASLVSMPGYWKVNSAAINGLTLVPGEHLIIYNNGPISITGNITAQGGITDASQVPTLEVIAKGDVSISGGVSQLYGNYIAENGTLNDCAQVSGSVTTADLTTNCSNKLTVNGSFIGNRVDLYRVSGSIHQASGSDRPGNNQASEEFDYSPADWLVPSQQTTPAVQSITSLPPIF